MSPDEPDSAGNQLPDTSAKAETAIVPQAPFTTRVMFEDDESHLPEAEAAELTEADLRERARAEEEMARRRDVARLEEEAERLAAAKKPTVISNPTWSTLPNEPTKTYDFSAVQLVDEMSETEDAPLPSDAIAVVVQTSSATPPPPPDEAPVDDQPLVVADPQPISEQLLKPTTQSTTVAESKKRRTSKIRRNERRGFAEWIHVYRLPIITFLAGIVVGVFIAFLF